MSANPVNFKYKSGHVGVVNKAVAETLEARGEGTILKGTPPEPKKAEPK